MPTEHDERVLREKHAREIAEAVAAERERCAKLVDLCNVMGTKYVIDRIRSGK